MNSWYVVKVTAPSSLSSFWTIRPERRDKQICERSNGVENLNYGYKWNIWNFKYSKLSVHIDMILFFYLSLSSPPHSVQPRRHQYPQKYNCFYDNLNFHRFLWYERPPRSTHYHDLSNDDVYAVVFLKQTTTITSQLRHIMNNSFQEYFLSQLF